MQKPWDRHGIGVFKESKEASGARAESSERDKRFSVWPRTDWGA